MRKNGKNSTALFDLIHLTRTWVMAANCELNSTRERAYTKEKRKSHENDKRKNDQQKQNVRFYAPNEHTSPNLFHVLLLVPAIE